MKEVFKEIFAGTPISVRIFFLFLVLFIVIFTFFSCSKLAQIYPQDNFIEEGTEKVIRQKTGVDIDLSPNSPETKKS